MTPWLRFYAAAAFAAALLALQACATGSTAQPEDAMQRPYPYSGSNW